MTPRLAAILIATAALLAVLALVVVTRDHGSRQAGGEHQAPGAAEDDSSSSAPVRVALYFPGANGKLVRESRDIQGSSDPSKLAAGIVAALLEGPRSEKSFRPFPEDVAVGEVHVTGDGIAYVDLQSKSSVSPPVEGSTGELLTLYSLVNSVVENVPGARSCVVLWNGRQPRTFGGHIDTSRPLLPEPGLAA